MRQYLNLMGNVLCGEEKTDRTGTGTYSIFGTKMSFDLRKGFPLLTTKKVHWKSIVYELLWIISGNTNIKYLKDNGVSIWNEWADENGELGPVYGAQWRNWENYLFDKTQYIDQLQLAIDQIKNDPHSRRIIVNAWNVGALHTMALPPCHMIYQFNVSGDGRHLDLSMYQRSVDVFLGLPFNIASYSLLLKMVAQVTGKIPRKFVWMGGDTHVYKNHTRQASEQLLRKPTELPFVSLNPDIKSIDNFTYDDIMLYNYKAQPHIKAPIAI